MRRLPSESMLAAPKRRRFAAVAPVMKRVRGTHSRSLQDASASAEASAVAENVGPSMLPPGDRSGEVAASWRFVLRNPSLGARSVEYIAMYSKECSTSAESDCSV